MTRAFLILLAVAFAESGCKHAGNAAPSANAGPGAAAAQPPAGGPMGGGMMAGMCPMSVPGTNVAAADTATGEALTFTTTPDQAGALREKVHAMADMHNRHHASGKGDGMMGGGAMGGMGMGGMGMPPPSRAAVEDLPNGARITVTPNDPGDLQRLQSTVRAHAEAMQQNGCGMMQHGQHGA